MSLDAIAAGAQVLIDANLLIYARRSMSEQCRRLVERCGRHEIAGVVTTIIVAEFCHRRMMQEAQNKGLSASNPAKALSQDPGLVRQLTIYRQDVDDLLAGDLGLLAVEGGDFARALEIQRLHGLLTNDSLNLAVAIRNGVHHIATADPQFDSIPDILVSKPDDL